MTAQAVKLWSGKAKPPKAWAAALGLAGEDAPAEGVYEPPSTPDSLGGGIPLREADGAPSPPSGAKIIAPASGGGDMALVKDRISKAYNAIGAGVSMATRNDGFGAVTEQYSDDIARAWVAAAKENQQIARVVAFMESGGPVGELVMCHIILVLGFVYVSGRAPALGTIYAGKFERYHAAAARERPIEEPFEGVNGSAPHGAESPMGHAPV